MQISTLFTDIPQDGHYDQHQGWWELGVVDSALYDVFGIGHYLGECPILILAEGVEELRRIGPQCGKWLYLILLLICIPALFDLNVPANDMNKRVDKLLRLLVIVFVIYRRKYQRSEYKILYHFLFILDKHTIERIGP